MWASGAAQAAQFVRIILRFPVSYWVSRGEMSYGTAATRNHARAARHPEGTLFLCFLVALLVLVALLAAPCQRRALGDAVLLPDEEDL